ncbi:MAG: TspO/MBR family protein [Bacteroidia bacterium]
MANIKWVTLAACIGGVLLIGFTSGIATAGGMRGWYDALEKPFFNPPSWVFGPAWTTLYTLMGIGLYMILQTPKSDARTTALIIFGVQLALNFAWSFLFFYFHRPGIALMEILTLWTFILLMILQFHKLSPTTGLLQLPYLAWVSFATLLNASIWYLNF